MAASPALLCLGAMAAGLAFDTRGVPLEVLAAWCADPASPWHALLRHWTTMPASHGLMLAAALVVPLPRVPRLQRCLCALTMTAGMSTAAVLMPLLVSATSLSPRSALLASMALGVAAGLAASHGVRPAGLARWQRARHACRTSLGTGPLQP